MVQLRTFQSNMSGGELAPAMYSRTDVGKYQSGLKLARNVTIKPQGGVRSRNGFRYVGDVADHAYQGLLMPFNVGVGESYVLELGDGIIRFIRDGAYVTGTFSGTITNVSTANPAVFTAAGHLLVNGRSVFLTLNGGDGPELTNRFYAVANVTATTFTLIDEWGDPVTTPVALTNGGTAVVKTELNTPYGAGDAVNVAQDQDKLYLFNHANPPQVLTRVFPNQWLLSALAIGTAMTAPTGLSATPTGGGGVAHTYVVSAVGANSGEEGPLSGAASATNDLGIAGNFNTLAWTAPVGSPEPIGFYRIYKLRAGAYGFIGTTTSTGFIDNNIIADVGDSPVVATNPFSGAGNYPKTGTFFEQRLIVANTLNRPNGVWGSQSTRAGNFNVSRPVKANEALTFAIRSSQVNEIEALVPYERLLILTNGGEWSVTGGSNEDFLTPTNIVLRQQAFRGSDIVQPLLIGDIVMHAQRGGGVVRDLLPRREIPSTEISLLARHLFRDRTVVSWAYSQSPDSIVWVVLDNGDLLALTYLLEHEIWGWTKMEFSGDTFIEQVAVANEANSDAVYIQARRTINSQVRRQIWRLADGEPTQAEDAFHVDAGVSAAFDEPATVVGGLHHLEGETLVGLVDGNVVRDLVVEDGIVVLPVEGTKVTLGLPYVARIKTLDLDLGPMRDIGSILARYKTMSEVTLRVEDTRGIFIAHENDDDMVEYRQRADEDWNEAISLFTGDITITPQPEWSASGGLVVEQRDPLPMTINGILIDWEFGE